MAKQISLPHNLEYRDYQKWIVSYLRNWGKRAILMYHRRGGKDKTMFNLCVEMAIREPGGYAYILPTYAQWKKIILDSIDKDGNLYFASDGHLGLGGLDLFKANINDNGS